ncbi:MAG TPA: hypothetical protein VI078_15035 [bacterium]
MVFAVLVAAGLMLGSAGRSHAMMMGWGGWTGGCGWTSGRGGMMTGAGGFGMMSGAAGKPVVGPDGTAYLVSAVPSATPGSTPRWSSFQSHLLAVSPAGGILKLTLDGLVSSPVLSDTDLIATASLPNTANYVIKANDGNTAAQSVIFWLPVPLSSSSVPQAVLMDGRYASQPVIANNQVYVTTSNFGFGMMQGNDVFNNTFPNFTVANTAKAYLYVFAIDGTLVSRTVLQ